MKRKKRVYIASCSFGKDSIATILLALEHKEPLDIVLFSEVMYDNKRGISAEIPEHRDWIYNTAIPKLKEMGLKVVIVRDDRDYLSTFHKVRQRGKYVGKIYGFPMVGKCEINKLKVRPINQYLKQFQGKEVIQYIGIAADEKRRLNRLDSQHISLLDKYGYTEAMATEKAKEYGLLSPLYDFKVRSGCWFCPNNKVADFARFKANHRELWDELVNLGDTPNKVREPFNFKQTIREIDNAINEISE